MELILESGLANIFLTLYTQNTLKEGALYPLTFKFAPEYALRKFQANQKGKKIQSRVSASGLWSGLYQ
jgi:hypothetical protein